MKEHRTVQPHRRSQSAATSTSAEHQREGIANCFKELTKPNVKPGQITLTKSCFWKFGSLRSIMALAGFQAGYCVHVRHVLFNAVSYLSMKRQKDPIFESNEQAIAASEAALNEIRSDL